MVVDLHTNLNVLLKYVDRYRKYLPVSSSSVQQKMQYIYNDKLLESSFDYYVQKQWDLTPSCNISLAESRDCAVGALIGLAVGDAVCTRPGQPTPALRAVDHFHRHITSHHLLSQLSVCRQVSGYDQLNTPDRIRGYLMAQRAE